MTCVGFSHDGAYVATGDMVGLIKVWKVATQQEVWSFEISELEVSEQLKKIIFIVFGPAERFLL